nr:MULTISPECIES: IS110 family transposase [unclassified Pseudomonas]
MAYWLVSLGITTVAMESTGAYWIPVYKILEAHGIQVVLANARDARAVPGRKTDVMMLSGFNDSMHVGCFEPAFTLIVRFRLCAAICGCGSVVSIMPRRIFSKCKKLSRT